MADLGTQLREHYDSVVTLFDPEDIIEGRVPRTVQRPRFRSALAGRPGWVVAVAAAVVVLVVVGGSLLLMGPSDGHQPVVTAPPTSTPVTEPAPLSDLSIGWSKVPDDFGGGFGGGFDAVTRGGPGLVAVGNACGDLVDGTSVCGTGAWVSADGIAWQGAPEGMDLDAGSEFLLDVAAGPSGLVAVAQCGGFDGAACDPGIWYSPDALTWEPVELAADVYEGCSTVATGDCATVLWSAVARGSGFVAAGRDLRGPGIWASPDGRDWTQVAGPDTFPEGVTDIWSVAVAGPRIVAVTTIGGWVYDDDGEEIGWTDDTYMWTSLDLIDWEPVPDPDGAFTSVAIEMLVAWDGGLAAEGLPNCGYNYCESEVWTSPDGLAWSHTPLPSDAGISYGYHRIAAFGSGLMVSGARRTSPDNNEFVAYFWTSDDGITWQRHNTDVGVFGSGLLPVNEFIWYDNALIGVGATNEPGPPGGPAIFRWEP